MSSFLKSKESLYLYVTTIIYSYIFVYIFPWENFVYFADIDNYLSRIIYLANEGKEKAYSGLSIITGEVVWKYILAKIASEGGNYVQLLYLISLFSLTVYTFFTFKRINIILASVLLLNPMFIDLIMGQIRIALAVSLLIIAHELKNKIYIYIILTLAILIHTASLLLILIYVSLTILNTLYNEYSNRKYYISSMILALFLALFLKYGIDNILLYIGDKRANYSDIIAGSSISYSIIWFLIALILILKVKSKNNEESIVIAFSISMMSLFFFSSLIGTFGQRYVALAIPLIIVSIGYLPKSYKYITFSALFLYQALQWIYWIKLEIL